MKLAASLLAGSLLLLLAASARPDRPLDLVRATADKIISILNDPSLQGEPKRAERHRLLRQELEQRFDWPTICRSCLARHWSKLTAAQQKEFTDLFKDFLERTYLDRIEPYYNELDRIDYEGERILEVRYASVRTVVVTKQKIEHPVEYRLEKKATGDWLVYDVVIEGVSLVKNYRTQFDEIIAKSSYQGLIDDLKAKIATPGKEG
jgi:phospholipid transport system substrate-binding protein